MVSLFKKMIELTFEAMEYEEILEESDESVKFSANGDTVIYSHLPELEEFLLSKFPEDKLTAYETNDSAGKEIEVFVEREDDSDYLIIFNLNELNLNKLEIYFMYIDKYGLANVHKGYFKENNYYEDFIEHIEEIVLDYIKNLNEYRLYFITNDVVIYHD